jgi:hypothetical protein
MLHRDGQPDKLTNQRRQVKLTIFTYGVDSAWPGVSAWQSEHLSQLQRDGEDERIQATGAL